MNYLSLIQSMDLTQPQYRQGLLPDMFSWAELETIINQRSQLTTSRFHVLCPRDKGWHWGQEAWLSDINTWPKPLVQACIDTWVCYLSDSAAVNSAVNSMITALDQVTGAATDLHIYWDLQRNLTDQSRFDLWSKPSPGGLEPGRGLGQHTDHADNLIVQVEGTTEFSIWAGADQGGQQRLTTTDQPVITCIMRPGDLVWVPKGHWHQARSLSPRLSLSFASQPNIPAANAQSRHWISLP